MARGISKTLVNYKRLSKSLSSGDLIELYVDKRAMERAQKLIEDTPDILYEGYKEGSSLFAKKLLKLIKDSLRTGMPPRGSNVSWPKHAPSTIRKLGEHKLLNYTGQYLRSVSTFKSRDGVYVGLPPGVKKVRGKSGSLGKRTLTQVATMLENGGDSLPPRPLWKPAYKVVGGNKELTKLIIKELRKQIRRYT